MHKTDHEHNIEIITLNAYVTKTECSNYQAPQRYIKLQILCSWKMWDTDMSQNLNGTMPICHKYAVDIPEWQWTKYNEKQSATQKQHHEMKNSTMKDLNKTGEQTTAILILIKIQKKQDDFNWKSGCNWKVQMNKKESYCMHTIIILRHSLVLLHRPSYSSNMGL